MSIFFNSITWPWKTRPLLKLKPEYYVLYCENPLPHVFQLGLYTEESRLTPVFPNKNGLTAYLNGNCPYPTTMKYKPISVADAQASGLTVPWPYAIVVPHKGRMPGYMKDVMQDWDDIQQGVLAIRGKNR